MDECLKNVFSSKVTRFDVRATLFERHGRRNNVGNIICFHLIFVDGAIWWLAPAVIQFVLDPNVAATMVNKTALGCGTSDELVLVSGVRIVTNLVFAESCVHDMDVFVCERKKYECYRDASVARLSKTFWTTQDVVGTSNQENYPKHCIIYSNS